MNIQNVKKWVLLTFCDGVTTHRYLFAHVTLPDGALNNISLKIDLFDPSTLTAQTKHESIGLAGKGFELGFDLDYLTPANEPESIISKLANRNNHIGRRYAQDTLKMIRWVRHFGNTIDDNLCLETTFEALQPWEIQ
ncbi:hypothetical protein [Halomonas stenophila]|uniref:Uncharacterized protein n=1 Tax=Halomonas stenophila TaxID=795312 RepID=A0A7W5EV34_9GAMM|nr:hypothetical protein [Halomonas stenophila]MBB3231923.1 hypothetical protein [Halomonas stenophila]